jgi:hypothetical protein
MSKLVPIGVAAGTLGVSTSTLRRWEATGRLVPVPTSGGVRKPVQQAIPAHGRGRACCGERQPAASGSSCISSSLSKCQFSAPSPVSPLFRSRSSFSFIVATSAMNSSTLASFVARIPGGSNTDI